MAAKVEILNAGATVTNSKPTPSKTDVVTPSKASPTLKSPGTITARITPPSTVSVPKNVANTKDSAAPNVPSKAPVVAKRARAEGERVSLESIEDRPLPSARELSKVLCRIVDTEVYSETDRQIALLTLKHWASKQNVAFGNHFADVGGLQQVLFFVEDNVEDCNCIAPALMLLETLCKPLQGAAKTIYETKALSTMRTKIGKCIVDVSGINMIIRIFQWHALGRRTGASTGSNKDNLESIPTEASIMDVVKKSCFFFECGDSNELDNKQIAEERKMLAIKTARHSLELLVLLIPHVIGVDKDAPSRIIDTLCEALPILMKANRASPNKEEVALIAALMTCLASTAAIASKETLAGPKLQRVTEIVQVTNNAMRTFDRHHMINRDGCLILQRVCRHLPKSERKRLGVVASLGGVVASMSIDQDVKDIADEILEEQFR